MRAPRRSCPSVAALLRLCEGEVSAKCEVRDSLHPLTGRLPATANRPSRAAGVPPIPSVGIRQAWAIVGAQVVRCREWAAAQRSSAERRLTIVTETMDRVACIKGLIARGIVLRATRKPAHSNPAQPVAPESRPVAERQTPELPAPRLTVCKVYARPSDIRKNRFNHYRTSHRRVKYRALRSFPVPFNPSFLFRPLPIPGGLSYLGHEPRRRGHRQRGGGVLEPVVRTARRVIVRVGEWWSLHT